MRNTTLICTSFALMFTLIGIPQVNAQDDATRTTVTDVDVLTVDFDIITPETAEDAAILIERVEEYAREMREAAARLQSFTRVPNSYSLESHAGRLNRIRDNLNDISDTVARLQQNESFLLPRQRLTVRYVAEELPTLAANLQYAIEYVNEAGMDGQPLWTDEYTGPVARIYDSADTVVEAAGLAERLSEISAFDENSDD